ncbi:hypothetical protein BJV82DRAFT_623718 [Fennellomyces sp. T-0311]|nr:hypothetical protein BJV82DRAFT_623718 [Fennellomyces sp. T-0311]
MFSLKTFLCIAVIFAASTQAISKSCTCPKSEETQFCCMDLGGTLWAQGTCSLPDEGDRVQSFLHCCHGSRCV